MSEPPAIPAGTVLHLKPGEWRDCPNSLVRLPSDDAVIVVARIYAQPVAGMVWLRGHLPGCALTDCSDPCIEGQVAVTALHRHARGQQG